MKKIYKYKNEEIEINVSLNKIIEKRINGKRFSIISVKCENIGINDEYQVENHLVIEKIKSIIKHCKILIDKNNINDLDKELKSELELMGFKTELSSTSTNSKSEYIYETVMGIANTPLPFLTKEQQAELNVIGYSGKTKSGIAITQQAYLNSLNLGYFVFKQTDVGPGDFIEKFLITRYYTTGE